MNESQETPPPADPAQMRAIARRLILPHAIIAALAVAAAYWFVLYGMNGGGGKETVTGNECTASKTIATALAPLAKGDVAAFSVSAHPKPLPALNFTGASGPTDLAAFKGRVVLLNLWATWCVPCREEMPALDRLQGLAGSDRFSVVAVNIDTARLERPQAFLQDIGVKNLNFYADSSAKIFQALQQAGKATGLPTTLLVGGDGCALGVIAGPAKWDGADALALVRAASAQP